MSGIENNASRMYFDSMENAKAANIVGALSLAIAGDVIESSQSTLPASVSTSALAMIGHIPGITIEQLRHALLLSHPGTVRAVDRLELERLVKRSRSSEDRRSVTLKLTAKGRRVCDDLLARRITAVADWLSALNAKDQQHLERIAERLLQAKLRDESHAMEICRLCDPVACSSCPVECEIMRRETESENS